LAGGESGETLRELVVRLIDGAKEYLRAEILLARQTAIEWAARARPAIAAIVVAILLLQAALTVLIAALGLALAHWIGMAGGFALAALLAIGAAGLLGWFALSRLNGKR
jgi:hypothetical protein